MFNQSPNSSRPTTNRAPSPSASILSTSISSATRPTIWWQPPCLQPFDGNHHACKVVLRWMVTFHRAKVTQWRSHRYFQQRRLACPTASHMIHMEGGRSCWSWTRKAEQWKHPLVKSWKAAELFDRQTILVYFAWPTKRPGGHQSQLTMVQSLYAYSAVTAAIRKGQTQL